MTPTQANKDQEEAGLAQQAGRPARAGKTTNRATVGADAGAAIDADATAAADPSDAHVGPDFPSNAFGFVKAAATHPVVPTTDQVMHMNFSNVPSGP